jgi:xanthine/uracil permease
MASVESLRNCCQTFWTYIFNYFPRYNFVEGGNIGIDERPHWATTFLFGVQHLLAMFGGNYNLLCKKQNIEYLGTVLVPRLAGFDPNTSLFFSGIGTLVFYIITGGKVPSFLGSSFAFLGVVQSATNYTPGSEGVNPEIGIALGGIIVCGLAYAVVAIVVIFIGYEWIEVMMPPIVTGNQPETNLN